MPRPGQAATALVAFLLAAPALAMEVSGVQVPEAIIVAGKELKLNGAGVRKRFVVKVYVGALYLATPSSDPAAIVQADEAKSVHMRFLRGVSRDQVMGAFRDGFENNSPEQAKALGPDLNRLAVAIPPKLEEGSQLTVTYEPGKGTTVAAAGGRQVTIEGKPFADAMFRNWLGKDPADSDLKQKMLGR